MMATLPAYELYAIRYAEHTDRMANENFIGGDPHDGTPDSPDDFGEKDILT